MASGLERVARTTRTADLLKLLRNLGGHQKGVSASMWVARTNRNAGVVPKLGAGTENLHREELTPTCRSTSLLKRGGRVPIVLRKPGATGWKECFQDYARKSWCFFLQVRTSGTISYRQLETPMTATRTSADFWLAALWLSVEA